MGGDTQKMVNTARGPIPTSAMGKTLMHEHVFVISPEVQQNWPEVWGDEEFRVSDAVKRLTELKNVGIDTIVDPTAIGLGRYIPRVKRIADQLELNIIVATGLYTFDSMPFFFGSRVPGSGPNGSDPMVDMFVKDIEEGIAGTGVKAGIIKCATDAPGLTPDVERVLRACAKTHRATGVPITTHTNAAYRRGLDQQRIFKDEGVDLSRVVIGHCGDTTDIDYLLEVVGNGSILGMDRFGIDSQLPTADRVKTVAEMCKRGYADRMVLSHDCMCYIDWIEGEIPFSNMPNWHYLHISQDVIPALLAQGVTQAQIDEMLVHVPRRFFEVQGAY